MKRTAGPGALVAALLVACGGGGGGGGGGAGGNDTALAAALQGGWTRCRVSTQACMGEFLGFSGRILTRTVDQYPLTGMYCSGDAVRLVAEGNDYAFGAPVTVAFGNTQVTAYEFNYTSATKPGGPGWIYDVIYLNPNRPNEFFTGDLAADAGRDGISADRRPNVLHTTRFQKSY